MTLADLIAELGEKATGQPGELNIDGSSQIVLEDGRVIDFFPGDPELGQAFVLQTRLGRLPMELTEAAMRELLDANLSAAAIGGGCLALDTDIDEVMLTRRIDERGITFPNFYDALEEFVAAATVWSERIGGGRLGTQEDEDDVTGPGSDPAGPRISV